VRSFEIINSGSQILWSAYGTIAGTLDFHGHEKLTNVWDEAGRRFFPSPMWSEDQKLIILLVSPQSLREEELWVYDTDLDLIEKEDAAPLQELWTRNMWKRQKTEHKYAWVMERRWNPQKLSPIEFHLKTHTIEHGPINPKDAASVW